MRTSLHKNFYGKTTRRLLTGSIIVFTLLAFFPLPTFPRIVDGIAIIVNKDPVLVSEINEAMMPIVQEYRVKFSGDELKQKLAELRETIIDQAIETKLIVQVAKANGITADTKDVDSRVDIIAKRFPSEEEFLQALSARGLTLREYREQVAEQVLVQETIKRVLGPDISAQGDEIAAYYDAHPDEFETKPSVKLAQIFLKLPREGSAKEIEETRKRAEQLQLMLEEGAEFSELASKYSEGPYRESGGFVGVIGPEEILPDLEKIAFGLSTGEISPVVQTAYGFHILQALEANPARKIGFEEAKPLIEERIYEEKRSERYADWIKKLREDSYIDIKI